MLDNLQAIIQSHKSKYLDEVAERVKAVIFLGTPHRGSSLTILGRLAAQALRPLGSNPSLVAEIEYDSTALLDLHREFASVIHSNIQVFNFYEEHPTRILKLWIFAWQQFVRFPTWLLIWC